jgi:hypothetical protein
LIDNISWILGSRIREVNATLHTFVKERAEEVDGTPLHWLTATFSGGGGRGDNSQSDSLVCSPLLRGDAYA